MIVRVELSGDDVCCSVVFGTHTDNTIFILGFVGSRTFRNQKPHFGRDRMMSTSAPPFSFTGLSFLPSNKSSVLPSNHQPYPQIICDGAAQTQYACSPIQFTAGPF